MDDQSQRPEPEEAGAQASENGGTRDALSAPHAIPAKSPDPLELAPEAETAAARARRESAAQANKAPSRVVTVDPDEPREDEDDDDAPMVDPETGKVREPLISPLLTSWRVWMWGSGVLLVVAMALAFHFEARHPVLKAVSAAYWTISLALAGAGGAYAIAKLERRQLGPWRELFARMGAASAFAQCIFQVPLPIPGKVEETLLGTGAFLVALMALFQWKPRRAVRVAGAMFAIALLLLGAVGLHALTQAD